MAFDLYDFVECCKDEGLSAAEALEELNRAQAEAEATFIEEYESRPDVCYGWYQQDIIDMYRRER